MLSSRTWPQLVNLLKDDKAPYIVSTPRLLEEQCASGGRSLCGHGLLSVRLDLALAGIMAELGEDFFHNDFFASRLIAAVDILTAARVFLQQPPEDAAGQVYRVSRLAREAQEVLDQWALLPQPENEQTLLIASEEAAELF